MRCIALGGLALLGCGLVSVPLAAAAAAEESTLDTRKQQDRNTLSAEALDPNSNPSPPPEGTAAEETATTAAGEETATANKGDTGEEEDEYAYYRSPESTAAAAAAIAAAREKSAAAHEEDRELITSINKLNKEEMKELEEEIQKELSSFAQFYHTTTTTKPPGIVKEAATGVVNFMLAPFRSARDVFLNPKSSLSSNVGSYNIIKEKVEKAITNKKKRKGKKEEGGEGGEGGGEEGEEQEEEEEGGGGWGEVARDVWRIVTMHPGRMKEAERRRKQININKGEAAKHLLVSDGQQANLFNESLYTQHLINQQEQERKREGISEDIIHKQFLRMMDQGQ